MTSLTFSPSSVNCTNGSATVTFTVTATDDLSGVSSLYAEFNSPSGNQSQTAYGYGANRTSGTALNGTYVFTAVIPQYAEAGSWSLAYLQAYDAIGNYVTLYTSDLSTRGFPTTLTVTSASDTSAPVVAACTFSPNSVNTASASATVNFSVTATDNLSGVASLYAEFTSPSGGQTQTAYGYSANRTSGSALNGTYSFNAVIPQYAENGIWTLSYLQAYDVIGNYVTLYTSDLQTMGFPTTLSVAGTSDVAAPAITAMTFSPQVVTVSASSATVTFTVTATDNLSGVSSLYAELNSPSGNQSQTAYGYSANRTSGSALNGTYVFSATIPQYAETGSWSLSYLQAYDTIGNYVTFYTSDLQAKGFPTSLTVQ